MDFLEQDTSLLSNYEVYTLLKHNASTQGGVKGSSSGSMHVAQNVKTVEFETLEYFTKVLPKATVEVPSEDSFLALMTSLSGYPLTKAERLQVVNLMPKSGIDFHIIVEDCEERFSGEQIGEILERVAHYGVLSNG